MQLFDKILIYWPVLAASLLFLLLGLFWHLRSARAMELSPKPISWVRNYRSPGNSYRRELLGSIQMHKSKADGLILMSAFPCGPDSMVNEMIIRKFPDIPILNIVMDNQDGTAGLETRLESFTDILKLKRGEL